MNQAGMSKPGCPYCGAKMFLFSHKEIQYYVCSKCLSTSPVVFFTKNVDDVYSAAMRCTVQLAKLEADRDAWKRRAEAAERELNGICWCCENAVPLEIAPSLVYPKSTILYTCNEIEKHGAIAGTGKRKCEKWKWRGPCAENGGKHEQDTPHATENG